MKITNLLIFILLSIPVFAANHFVLKGAAGTASGADWTNACTDFTGSCAIASLVRGDTYYVGTGTYVGKTWNRATSGALVITIKHATVTDHGTATGWSDSFAAQTVWTGREDFETDNWVFDGQVGDYRTLGIGSYGFQDSYSTGSFANCGSSSGGILGAGFLMCANNITVQYVDCVGFTGTGDFNYPNQAKCFELYGSDVNLIQHVAMHGCESCLQGGGGGTVQFSYIYNSRSISTNFHNNVFFMQGANGLTFRYNQVWDYNAEGIFITMSFPQTAEAHIFIYGNTFAGDGTQSDFPRGVEIRQNDFGNGVNYFTDVQIYNNTFIGLSGGGIQEAAQSDGLSSTGNTCQGGCKALNNLSVNAGNTFATWNDLSPANNTDNSVTSVFVSTASLYTYNLRLTTNVGPGSTLLSPYNLDLDGNTRGSNGTWDRGAFQIPGASASQSLKMSGTATMSGSSVMK